MKLYKIYDPNKGRKVEVAMTPEHYSFLLQTAERVQGMPVMDTEVYEKGRKETMVWN